MNKEDIIRMALEVGFVAYGEDAGEYRIPTPAFHGRLERFAALVANAERERIKQANAPEIKKINAHIKALEVALAEPKHKPHCALLKIPSRDCDCSAEPVQETCNGMPAIEGPLSRSQRPAEPVQEPVAWVCYGSSSDEKHAIDYQQEDIDAVPVGAMLYTAPPQRKPLTDEEIDRITRDRWGTQLLGVMVQAHREYARAVEVAHGIGGQDE